MALAAGAILVLALPPYSILPLCADRLRCAGNYVAWRVVALRVSDWDICFGLGQFVPGLFWITESFQVEADRFGWLALPAVFGLAALLAVFPALACALAARMARAGLPLALSLATSWTGLEWLRGHVLTGFPWNLAAYTLADWSLFRASGLLCVGSYGLGFLLVLCSALAGLAFRLAPTADCRSSVSPAPAQLRSPWPVSVLRACSRQIPRQSAARRSASCNRTSRKAPNGMKDPGKPTSCDFSRFLPAPATTISCFGPKPLGQGFLQKTRAPASCLGWLLPNTARLAGGQSRAGGYRDRNGVPKRCARHRAGRHRPDALRQASSCSLW